MSSEYNTNASEFDNQSFDNGNNLLDFLFDYKNGILSDYGIDSAPGDQTDDLFNCLNGFDLTPTSDLLSGDPLVDFGDLLAFDGQFNIESPTSVVPNYRQCISDHPYSRLPNECTAGTENDASNSPTYFYPNDEVVVSHASPPYLCTSEESVNSGSPLTDSTATIDDDTGSPDSRRMAQTWSDYEEQSNLVGDMEDVNVSNFVESLLCDDGRDLVSVDMNPDGEMSTSDEDSTTQGYGGGRSRTTSSHSLFDFSPFGKQNSDSLPFTINDLGVKTLCLSDEERKLLAREGVTLPTDLPLTKEEERALKAVRRKIRNKVSAKTSRKRKQEYVDGLEKRVKHCSVQNRTLMERVDRLEKQNSTLIDQLKKLKSLITTPNTTATVGGGIGGAVLPSTNMMTGTRIGTGTCIMVLILSFGLFVIPSLDPIFGGDKDLSTVGKNVGRGVSRNLLEANTVYNAAADRSIRGVGGREQYITANPLPPYPFLPSPDESMSFARHGQPLPSNEDDEVIMENDELIENYNKSSDGIESAGMTGAPAITGPLAPEVNSWKGDGVVVVESGHDAPSPLHEIHEGIHGTNSNAKNDL